MHFEMNPGVGQHHNGSTSHKLEHTGFSQSQVYHMRLNVREHLLTGSSQISFVFGMFGEFGIRVLQYGKDMVEIGL